MTSHEQRTSIIIPAEQVRDVIVQTLRTHGATEPDSYCQANILLEADLRGQHSHGVRRVATLAARLTNGVATSGITPGFTWVAGARLHVDGFRGLGPAVAQQTLKELIPSARRHGIGIASITNANHLGMMAPYVEYLAAEGCIGIALTVSEALVAPWGGSRAMVGTNPIGIAIPTATEPVVLDMSTAAVSAGRIIDYAARGEPLQHGWAVDANGESTTDASAAVDGAISAFGGSKGYALGLAFEVLVGVLAGTSFGRDVHGTLDTHLVATKGDVFIAIPASSDHTALTAYLDQLRGEGNAEQPVLIPGDRARALRADRLRNGIPLDSELWDDIVTLSNSLTRSMQ